MRVIHEAAGERLAGGVVDHRLAQRLACALHDAAMDLAVQDQRIDRLAAVVHRGIAADRDEAGLRIDLDLAHRRAGRIGGDASDEARRALERRPQLRRQRRIGLDGAGDVEDVEPAVRARRDEEAVGEFDLALGAADQRGEHLARLGDDAVEASTSSVPAIRMERSEWVPPPDATTAVSPVTSLTCSGVMPSLSASTWAKLVSWPWPLDCVPATASTAPSARTLTSTCSLGTPTGDST